MDDGSGDRIGQRLGNYRLIRLLGQGGFGEVYLGEHIYLQGQAAIKVLQTRLARQDMESFLAEARTIARLRHPHIIGVLEFGVENGLPYLVMDYAPNGTLKQRHPRGTPLPLMTVTLYTSQVAAALQYAHEQKYIHRDIKPENMLLGPNHEVLLSDFGIAVIAQGPRDQRQKVAGTVIYMSPEQLQGKSDHASDQYALAIVVYEWLTGDIPFHGGFVQIAGQHLLAPPPPLRGKVPIISPSVEQVVLKALAKDPQQRFPSVQDFAEALEQASQSDTPVFITAPPVDGPASTASSPDSLSGEQSLQHSVSLPSKPQARSRRLSTVTALLAALALLVIGGGLTYYATALQPDQLHLWATATSIANTTATAQAGKRTATAHTQATAQVQATTTALQTLYTQSTRGSPALNDPLSAQDQYKWDERVAASGGSCLFTGGAYVVTSSQTQGFLACIAKATSFSNFAFQVQVGSIQGDSAAVYFRITDITTDMKGYRFSISTSGEYFFAIFTHATQGQTLHYGISPAIHTQPGQANEITVIAKGNDIAIYVNQQYVIGAIDSTFNNGAIGVGAGYVTGPAVVTFSNVKVWTF